MSSVSPFVVLCSLYPNPALVDKNHSHVAQTASCHLDECNDLGVDGIIEKMGLQAVNDAGVHVKFSKFLDDSSAKKGDRTLRELKNLQWDIREGHDLSASKKLSKGYCSCCR